MGKLANKIAVITGGSTGIGLATAKLFQTEGAQVVVTGRNESSLAEARKELGPAALVVRSDASKLSDVDALVEQVRRKYGRIDVLYANAGVAHFNPIGQVTPELFDTEFDINVRGVYFTVQKALPLIPKGGVILFTSSIVNQLGMPDTSVYSATKAALRSLGRTLAAELAPLGIRVNTISPGPIKTPIFDKMGLPDGGAAQFENYLASIVALKRLGNSDEVARGALYLASEDSSFVVGADLVIDGGYAEL